MASTSTQIPNRRTIAILADTKRAAEASVEALRYGGHITDGCTVSITRDTAAHLVVATITLSYSLQDEAIRKLRTF